MLQTAWLLPPTRLLTLGFDPARFQTEPPACYRASWQLPGRDSHPLATTSLCWITIYMSTSNPGRTAEIELAPSCAPCFSCGEGQPRGAFDGIVIRAQLRRSMPGGALAGGRITKLERRDVRHSGAALAGGRSLATARTRGLADQSERGSSVRTTTPAGAWRRGGVAWAAWSTWMRGGGGSWSW